MYFMYTWVVIVIIYKKNFWKICKMIKYRTQNGKQFVFEKFRKTFTSNCQKMLIDVNVIRKFKHYKYFTQFGYISKEYSIILLFLLYSIIMQVFQKWIVSLCMETE